MGFDEQIKMLIDEAEIPERLSPDNIALMLKEKSAVTNRNKIQHKTYGSVKSKNKAIALRSTAAVAACVALTFGVIALVEDADTPVVLPEITQDNKASDYHDVYSVIQDTIINNTDDEGYDVIWAEQQPTGTTASPVTNNIGKEKYAVSDYVSGKLESADIIRTDGTNLYYIANNSLYFISSTDGRISELQKIYSEDKIPAEMYIEGNKLVVISNNTVEVPYEAGAQTEETSVAETAADSTAETSAETSAEQPKLPETIKQNNTVIDIYNIEDKTSPKLESTYKQNGAYISSGMSGASLYLITNYSNFRTKPLDSESDLDNYVPSYYINNEKYYVDVNDIVIPSKASGTYSIVSGFDVSQAATPKSIKAVLANGKSAYFTENSLYLIGNSSASANGKPSSSITKFKLTNGTVDVTEFATLPGAYTEASAMDEVNGSFRIATVSTDSKSGSQSVGIFIYNDKLVLTGSLESICEGQTIEMVCLEGGTAYVVTSESNAPTEISLADVTAPVISEATQAKSVYLYNYGNGMFVEFSAIFDESGAQTGVKLAMVKTTDGIVFTEVTSVNMDGAFSPLVCNEKINGKALIVDGDNNIIGVPMVYKDTYGDKNLYYVFSYEDGTGFSAVGTLEYTDIDRKFEFNRAVRIGDTLYVFSNGRAVSAQLSDLMVIDTLELK